MEIHYRQSFWLSFSRVFSAFKDFILFSLSLSQLCLENDSGGPRSGCIAENRAILFEERYLFVLFAHIFNNNKQYAVVSSATFFLLAME